MQIFNGKREAEKILWDLKKRIDKKKLKPVLAVILVGREKASQLYIKIKKKQAKKIGIKLTLYKFKGDERESKIIKKINSLNNNSFVDGIIVQMPLPSKFNPTKIIGAIDNEKDVDGFKKKSLFPSVLPSAIFLALKKGTSLFKNKKIIALVNSRIFGLTLKDFLAKKEIAIDYILRKKINQQNLIKKIKSADILITVCGVPGLIKSNLIKKKAILVDAGISYLKNKKVVGDIDRTGIDYKAAFLTPTPGGIGPLTVALLFKNVYLSALNRTNKKTLKLKNKN